MTLRIHRAERTDLLADGLAALVASPLPDPFAQEVVVVPARGVERWLTQVLSHRLGAAAGRDDGVCAGVRLLTPYSLVSLLLDRGRDDPWQPDALVWPLLRVIDESLDDDWCAPLAAHLGHGGHGGHGGFGGHDLRRSRRWSVARRLAGLFAGYAAQRPALVTDWREGRDTDGAGGALDDDLSWQPELWRRVVGLVSAEQGVAAPDLRHAEALDRLRAGGADLALPDRLSLFGHTRLTRPDAQLLAALGAVRDVHLWLPQASADLWDRLAPVAAAGPVARSVAASEDTARHPLLDTLGRDARELQRTLGGLGAEDGAALRAAESEPEATTLLGWLHADLRADRPPDAATRATRVVEAADRSVQVHACHGLPRQVEVLREVLLGLLADDPTLEPRDVIVLCPDVEQLAPLVHAGFGLGEVEAAAPGHPAHGLRVRLADRAPVSTNPLLALAASLVELAGGRITAAQVLDLAGRPPVRRRFGLDDDDLAQLGEWVRQASVRWGLDAEHRRAFGLDLPDNTWRAGLDRVLLGVAMAEDRGRHLGRALPLDAVAGNDVDLAGRLAELVARLEEFVDAVAEASSPAAWLGSLTAAVHALGAVPPEDAWQAAQLDRELGRTVAAAGTAGDAARLRLPDVRSLLRHLLAGRPTRSSFRTGTLTVCTMVPMRSVPHRVVALVGLDDGVFPRVQTVDGDDVLARTPQTGERDLRSEDRQLLLDAVLAAREALVITYDGANEHTGAPRPPSVPLGELLDSLDATAVPDPDHEVRDRDGDPVAPTRVRDQVVLRHPLQPYDDLNLAPGALVPDHPFSFDPTALAGAMAARSAARTTPPFLPAPLPPLPAGDVALDDLRSFLVHPVRWFLRSRLGVGATLDADELPVAVPITLDNLEQWGVGDRILRDVLAGAEPHESMLAEQLRGLLPPGGLGQVQLADVVAKIRPLHARAVALRAGDPRSVDVDVDLGGGRRLRGTVDDLHGQRQVRVTFSRLGPRVRLESWVDLLALSASFPDQHWTAHAVGRGPGRQVAESLLGPVDHRAVGWLRELVDLFDRGTCEPLPLPLKTAQVYAEERQRELRGNANADPLEKARSRWETNPFEGGWAQEDGDPHHVRVFGESCPLARLHALPPRDDEHWVPGEGSRMGQLALRLWSPIFAAGREGAL